MKTFTAEAKWDDTTRRWGLIAEPPGAYSSVKYLSEADADLRDAIAYLTDTDPQEIAIKLSISLPTKTEAHLKASERARATELQQRSLSAKERRAAAQSLLDRGIPASDIGRILGITRGRVYQLLEQVSSTT